MVLGEGGALRVNLLVQDSGLVEACVKAKARPTNFWD
jgi:hypothetical protein